MRALVAGVEDADGKAADFAQSKSAMFRNASPRRDVIHHVQTEPIAVWLCFHPYEQTVRSFGRSLQENVRSRGGFS